MMPNHTLLARLKSTEPSSVILQAAVLENAADDLELEMLK